MTASASRPGAGTQDRRDGGEVPLVVVPPAIPREEVDSTGRVGAVAYPYRVVDARVRMERPWVHDREDEFVASVDRSRRLAVRADAVPETERRTVDDVLVIPPEVTAEQADEMARDAVFRWTMRRYSLREAPEIALAETRDVYKLFWLAERPDGDVVVDSVDGDRRPLQD